MTRALLSLAVCGLAAVAQAGYGLLYMAPAEDSDKGWEQQSLPIGCGHFGANVFGIVTNERVQVTYNALHNRDPRNPKKANLTDALEIRLRTDHTGVSDYSRGLDLDSAIAWVEYVADGVKYRREYFADYPSSRNFRAGPRCWGVGGGVAFPGSWRGSFCGYADMMCLRTGRGGGAGTTSKGGGTSGTGRRLGRKIGTKIW